MHPREVIDIRLLTSTNFGTEHGLILCKINLKITKKKPVLYYVEKLDMENMRNPNIKKLYSDRQERKLKKKPGTKNLDLEHMGKIKKAILKVGNEALGRGKLIEISYRQERRELTIT